MNFEVEFDVLLLATGFVSTQELGGLPTRVKIECLLSTKHKLLFTH